MSKSKIVRRLAVAASFLTIPLVTVLPAATASAAAAGPSSATPSGIAKVQNAAEVPAGSKSLGTISASAPLSGAVVLKPRDENAVKAFIASVTNKKSPQFHHYLAPGAYRAAFGPSASTIALVKNTLSSAGLTVTNVASDGLVVDFSGTAGRVEAAFHTSINRYQLADGTTGQATTTAVQLPAAIAGSVSSVIGLDNVVHAQPQVIRRSSSSSAGSHPAAQTVNFVHPPGSPTACADASNAAQFFGGLTDDQIANAYGAFGLYQNSDFGAGQHIAVYELEQFLPSDLQTFDTCYFGADAAAQMAGTDGVPGGRLSVIPVDGGQPTGPGGGEAILDVQDVSAIAPDANVDVFEAPNNTFGGIDEYSQIINNTDPSTFDHIITSSWGLCEQAVQAGEPGVQQAENLLFEQAAAQGQSVFSAAGDVGSDTCNAFRTTAPVTPILSVNDPSSQPYVVAVGGTTIDDATQPPSEHVWNDGAAFGAGGGGISQSWPMPNYQLDSLVPGINNPGQFEQASNFEAADLGQPGYNFCGIKESTNEFESACRELPDVSAQADEFTGGITIFAADFGGWFTIGGTSSATPIWAGLLALINDSQTSPSCSAPSTGVGFVNPLLYAVASNPTAYAASFNDITAGNNDPYGASNLFPAGPGYDMASGLGSPNLTAPGGGAGLAWYLCNYAPSATTPSVSSLSVTVGSTTAFTPLTINGSGFEDGQGNSQVTGVQVGGFDIPGEGWNVTGPGTIDATLPPSSFLTPPADTTDGAGGYQVTVTISDGETSVPTPNSLFEYVDENGSSNTVPAVTSVRTYGGSEDGGNVVDIFGTGFEGVTGAGGVTFGGVDATAYSVLSDFEIQATVPAYSGANTTCAQDGSTFSASENATNDICQVEVVVTNGNGSSATSDILPLYEGAFIPDPNGVIPAPNGQEAAPQPTEYDYVPDPTISSISTDGGPGSLASEEGGSVVTITGSGFNLATLDWLDVGPPDQQSSQQVFSLIDVTGTEVQFAAPGFNPTADTTTLPVSIKTVAGQSDPINITYAGVPNVTSVTVPSIPNTEQGISGAPDTGGTPIDLTGAGFQDQLIGIQFFDFNDGFSLGTQYNFNPVDDADLTTATVPQNPGVMDVEPCTVSGCSFNPPGDELILFPPGNPTVDSLSPSSGPAPGGNEVTISGENLGCVTGVFFGGVPAESFQNGFSFLTCGATNEVDATAPPGAIGSDVPVTVTTVESDLMGGEPATNADYHYLAVAPEFTADSPPGLATRTRPFSYTFKASGDPAPTFSVSSGQVPYGLTLNRTTGVLSGSPTTDGTYRFKVTASNGVLPSAMTPLLTIVVVGGDTGYRLFGSDGSVYSFGTETSHGSLAGKHLNRPIVGMATTPDGNGYWLVGSDGGIFTFGNARYFGSTGNVRLHKPIVGMATTPDGKGYWLVASDGGIFTFGDARYFGSTGNVQLKQPIVGMATTPDGKGYWLVASDGGIFTFGDAHYFGSTGNQRLAKPIVAMARTVDGNGYWFVASDGGVFGFGDARYHGSLGGVLLRSAIVGMAASPDSLGYALVSGNGEVSKFGDFTLFGSVANQPIPAPIRGMSL